MSRRQIVPLGAIELHAWEFGVPDIRAGDQGTLGSTGKFHITEIRLVILHLLEEEQLRKYRFCGLSTQSV